MRRAAPKKRDNTKDKLIAYVFCITTTGERANASGVAWILAAQHQSLGAARVFDHIAADLVHLDVALHQTDKLLRRAETHRVHYNLDGGYIDEQAGHHAGGGSRLARATRGNRDQVPLWSVPAVLLTDAVHTTVVVIAQGLLERGSQDLLVQADLEGKAAFRKETVHCLLDLEQGLLAGDVLGPVDRRLVVLVEERCVGFRSIKVRLPGEELLKCNEIVVESDTFRILGVGVMGFSGLRVDSQWLSTGGEAG